MGFSRYFPILSWAASYTKGKCTQDLIAALIVTIMLIPQSLAYAFLAGLPPEIGLYASIAPLAAYAIFGTSSTLAVGPVAIVSLMTASAVGAVAEQGIVDYVTAALALAAMSGLILLAAGILRLGFFANFLSHPVISGFITASGFLIAVSQVKHLIGVTSNGHTLPAIIMSFTVNVHEAHLPTMVIGVSMLLLLFGVKRYLHTVLMSLGGSQTLSTILARTGPVIAIFISIFLIVSFDLDDAGVKILGDIPQSLPTVSLPDFDLELWGSLFNAALIISLIGFVESVSVAKTLAAKKREYIHPDQELIALGAANLSAGLTSGYPVTGGLARSAVNFDAGAQTPAAGIFTAVGIAIATLFLTPYLYYLPNAVLAATIIIAVTSLIDIPAIFRVWRYSRFDFLAMAATILITLIFGVELGVVTGVLVSLLLHLYNTSRPHFAVVGLVPDSHHFRNIERHNVEVCEQVLTLRIDESLYFANVRFLEDIMFAELEKRPATRHLILMCSAVNHIDASALESLEAIDLRLHEAGIQLHFSEVKGPVMDKLKGTHFLKALSGNVYLSQFDAYQDLKLA
jgi:SulP family sulfate permease